MKTALLLSGGMDSIALAYLKHPDLAITIDYGQVVAKAEIRAASAVCEFLRMPHEVVSVDCSALGSGDLAGRPSVALAPVSEWWPFRNQLLITLAAMKAVPLGVQLLHIGTVKTDAVHADGSESFVNTMGAVLQLQEGQMNLEAPAIRMTSAELIRTSGVPRDILSFAHSCHVAEFACGKCRGCSKHYQTMEDLGFEPY
ncbi:MAG: 7-cyano-7-deazaguanine synthase [Dehalococcoidia bacterium]|nr:7-cyano-7-deazaguanine synthase [Dehalococcoidia bacterium]